MNERLEELSYEECMDLVATQQVGRLAVIVGYYPQVFPVNFRLDDFVVVFRTNLGTKLLAADHANIGFEVDHIDLAEGTGWSVLIQGMAEDVTDRRPGDTTKDIADKLGVEPFAGGERDRLVRVIPAQVTGRRIPPHELVWATDDRGYL